MVIELYEKDGYLWIRGQLSIKATDEPINPDEVIGIATEDIKKEQVAKIKI